MGFLFKKKRRAFEGIPYDSKSYYASGFADHAAQVRHEIGNALLAGGIAGVKIEPWSIRMTKWFSESRDYLLVRYEGVWLYLLVMPFGKDLYASWISFFKLGCLQRLVRFGRNLPSHLDVDDLDMVGQGTDLYLNDVLDRIMKGAGAEEKAVQDVFQQAKRKKFIKAGQG
jgi:hypothetical protein